MTEEGFKRKLTAILSADVKDYSRLMEDDEAATVRTLNTYRTAMSDLIQQYRGRVVDATGDNIMAEFTSVVDAVNCAVEIQRDLAERNAELAYERRMEFRIGVNLGDVIDEDGRIYGDGVNIAARVENLAEPGGICISGRAYDQVANKLGLEYENLGEHQVKNISTPIRVYRVLSYPGAAAHRVLKAKEVMGKKWRKIVLVAAAVLVIAAAAAAVWNYYLRPYPVEVASVEKMAFPLPDKPSIAVLPFDNMSGDPEQDYFSDGLTDQIISALSKVPDLFVIARNSTFTYKGKPVKVQQVAEEMGVRYVLEGTVRKAEGMVRITTQLVDALTGHHLWSESYDRDLKDIFALQDEITMKVVTAMRVKLTSGEQARLSGKGTQNLKAYLKYLEGLDQFLLWNKEANVRAKQLLKEAIALDPKYSVAFDLLGTCHLIDALYGWSKLPSKSFQRAFELAQKALSLDDSLSDPYVTISKIHFLQGKHEEAIAEAQQAIEINPNHAWAIFNLGWILRCVGKAEEGIPLLKKAIRLNPISHVTEYDVLGRAYFLVGRYEEAIAEYRKAVNADPDYRDAHVGLASIYALLGREEEARAEVAEILRIDPSFSIKKYLKFMYFQVGLEPEIEGLRRAGLPEHPPLQLPDKPSIAVLPFVNMSGDPEKEYFCDGIADQIISAIAKIPYITVIARTSSFAYKGKSVNVQQIASDLGVRYILEGSLQRDNENVRINIQLIDAKTGGHLWAENYDRKLDDIFSVQDEICKNIMIALQVKLTVGEVAHLMADTVNIKAYEKYLQSQDHSRRRTMEDSLVARKLAQEAIALDPKYAAAYLQIGWTYLDEVWFGMTKTPSESMTKAEEMVQKAASIRGFGEGENALLSSVHLLKKDLEKAISYAEKAVEQRPNFAYVHFILAMALRSNGQYDEAILRYKKALQLNPVRPITYLNNLAWAYLSSKQYEKAISIWNETLERNPDYLFAYMGLTSAYWLTGSKDQAQQAAQHVLRINPKFSVGYWEKRVYVKDKEYNERIFDAWRKAGLK